MDTEVGYGLDHGKQQYCCFLAVCTIIASGYLIKPLLSTCDLCGLCHCAWGCCAYGLCCLHVCEWAQHSVLPNDSFTDRRMNSQTLKVDWKTTWNADCMLSINIQCLICMPGYSKGLTFDTFCNKSTDFLRHYGHQRILISNRVELPLNSWRKVQATCFPCHLCTVRHCVWG